MKRFGLEFVALVSALGVAATGWAQETLPVGVITNLEC